MADNNKNSHMRGVCMHRGFSDSELIQRTLLNASIQKELIWLRANAEFD